LARAGKEDVKSARLEVAASRTRLGQSFTGILEAELLQRRDEFRALFPKWAECFNAVADTLCQSRHHGRRSASKTQ
jgi:hypothetical protein